MTDKTPEQILAKNMEFAKNFDGSAKLLEKLYDLRKNRKISAEQINRYLDDPYANATQLQNTMQFMINVNGIVKEIIGLKTNILTLDHFLICNDMSKYKDKTKFDNAYRKAAYELRKYNIKFNVRWMLEKLIEYGEVYIYKLQDSDGITFIPMPNDYCKVTSAKGGVQYYSVNLDKITNEKILAFPDEVQKIHKKKQDGKLKNDKKYKDGFYPLDKKVAYAFSLNYLAPKNIPYYSNLLKNLSRLNDMMDLDDDNAMLENFKLLQILFPIDKATGEILVDFESANQYYSDVVSKLPNGMACVGLPYSLNNITLGDTRSKDVDYTNKLRKSTYDSAGVDSSLFNSDSKNNNQAVIYSSIIDTLLPLRLLEQFRLGLNDDFLNNSTLKNFSISFVDSTEINKAEKVKLAMANITTYNSRLQLLAYQGLEPWESYNLIRQEDLMGLDELMKPMITSHTATNGESGRLTVKDSDDTQGDVTTSQN